MTGAENSLYIAVGTTAGALEDKKAAYVSAANAAQAANTALASAKAALDAAYTGFVAADASFKAPILTPPDGYTPPA